MKHYFPIAFAALLTACAAPTLKIEVSNLSETDREDETVEVAWSEVAALKGATPENIVVFDDENVEIPSQVLYLGEDEPQALIFQCDVEEQATRIYTIKTGQRSAYAPKAYGRFVPERLDDYAWENDKVAFRAYGPALETAPGEMLATPGFDTWVKCVDTLVVDARYLRGNYHHNYGDGMDCYKVGRTLGAGASAPYVNDTLWMSRNFATWETLDNGPIRTTVRFTYAPFAVGNRQVSLTKVISLDAGSHFNRIENTYEGDFTTLPVAAGFVRHDVKGLTATEEWLGFYEAASDSKQPEIDGDLYFGVILPGADFLADAAGHALAVTEVENGVPSVYYAGSGWSQGGVEDMPDWMETLEQTTASVAAPLIVTIVE